MNKRKIIIITITITVVAIICIVLGIMLNRKENTNEITNNTIIQNEPQVKVTGNLKKYIDSLTSNYYIKYSGKFKDEQGNLKEAIVEYTLDGNNFALRSTELNIQVVCLGDRLSSISNRYKMIVEMPKSSFDRSQYNLASDFGQTFVKLTREKINNTYYEVEEYKYGENTLKYYFVENTLKFIQYNEEQIKIIRLERKTYSEMFTIPDNYEKVVA